MKHRYNFTKDNITTPLRNPPTTINGTPRSQRKPIIYPTPHIQQTSNLESSHYKNIPAVSYLEFSNNRSLNYHKQNSRNPIESHPKFTDRFPAKRSTLKIRKQNSKECTLSLSKSSRRVENDEITEIQNKITKSKSFNFNPKKQTPKNKTTIRSRTKTAHEKPTLPNNRKHSDDFEKEFKCKVNKILTQPISQSIFVNEANNFQLESRAPKSFKIELDSMLKDSKVRGTVHQSKIGAPLNFNTGKQKLRTNGNFSPEAKYSYSKFYDQEISTRSKRNSLLGTATQI